MSKPRVADDFAVIKARMEELRRERDAANARKEGEAEFKPLPAPPPPTPYYDDF